jgi:hypothetical protein
LVIRPCPPRTRTDAIRAWRARRGPRASAGIPCARPHGTPKTTWKPHTRHGDLDTVDRDQLPDSVYAFPKQRKEPLTDASHVRNALARFDQVQDVSDTERDLAFANIKRAADHYGIDVEERSWHDLGKRPHTRNPSQ